MEEQIKNLIKEKEWEVEYHYRKLNDAEVQLAALNKLLTPKEETDGKDNG